MGSKIIMQTSAFSFQRLYVIDMLCSFEFIYFISSTSQRAFYVLSLDPWRVEAFIMSMSSASDVSLQQTSQTINLLVCFVSSLSGPGPFTCFSRFVHNMTLSVDVNLTRHLSCWLYFHFQNSSNMKVHEKQKKHDVTTRKKIWTFKNKMGDLVWTKVSQTQKVLNNLFLRHREFRKRQMVQWDEKLKPPTNG